MAKYNEHIEFGAKGEQIAIRYLKSKGYVILRTNFRFKRGEVDIIAENEKFTVFAEVKARSNISFGNPEEAVDTKKERLIKLVATHYMNNYQIKNLIRFDIIAIIRTGNKYEIAHFEDAF